MFFASQGRFVKLKKGGPQYTPLCFCIGGLQDGLKMVQDDSKMTHSWPKIAAKWPHHRLKVA